MSASRARLVRSRLAITSSALNETSWTWSERSGGRRASAKPCRRRPVGEVEHAQAVVVARPLARGEVPRVAPHRPHEPGEPEGERDPESRATAGSRRSAAIHGGVVSRPHSQGWMSVTSPVPDGSRSRYSHAWWASSRGTTSARNASRVAPSSRSATRRAAMASTGGWVMHDVRDGARRSRVTTRAPESPAALVVHVVGEDHVRDHAVRPLAAEHRAQLAGRPLRIVTGEPDRDEARVPEPLVRVDARGGTRPVAAPVPVEDGERRRGRRRRPSRAP